MAHRAHVPDRGDIVWPDFTPQAGHQQAGHRPALVLSPARYNRASGLMLCCPMTMQVKGYPFEVPVDALGGQRSAVLADQVRSVDWRARRAQRKGRTTDAVVGDVLAKIRALLL
jgi:mRNA interferase MazF